MSKEETTAPIKVKKTKRNGFAEAQSFMKELKNEKTMLLSLCLIFHFCA